MDFCDSCETDYEKEKCGLCNSSLCESCIVRFKIQIGNFGIDYGCFCDRCLSKLQFSKTKKGREYVNKILEEIKEELNKRIEKINKK